MYFTLRYITLNSYNFYEKLRINGFGFPRSSIVYLLSKNNDLSLERRLCIE